MNNVRKAGLGLAGAIAAATVVAALGGRGLGVPASGGRQAPAAQEQARVLRQDDPASKADVSFATDDTTEVLIDVPEVDSDQIVKVVKHGDHWHIFTKDGREIITYSDPSQAKSGSQLSNTAKVVGTDGLREAAGDEVVRILRHGNHWHVFTADGREFVTYEDPSALYPHAYVGEYSGSHSDHGHDGGQGARRLAGATGRCRVWRALSSVKDRRREWQ